VVDITLLERRVAAITGPGSRVAAITVPESRVPAITVPGRTQKRRKKGRFYRYILL
jgi:hypothetical protein